MAPILGIMASQITGHLWAPSGAYDSIATVTVGSGGSSLITFSSIPSTYTHLQVRSILRNTAAAGGVDSQIRFNNDTTAGNYVYYHQLYGDGTNAISNNDVSSKNSSLFSFGPGASQASGIFGVSVLDILDYKNTSKNKTIRNLNGYDANGTGYVILRSGLWMQTSAITQIDISPLSGSFAEYSQFALYGIKGD